MRPNHNPVLVIGGGPAGLRAAEVATAAGARVIVCDGQRSVGRKFLVAGRGGLNLTHSEPVEDFPARYLDEPERWRDLLGEFGPDDLRAWAAELGVETYVGTSGRIFPLGQKAAGLLRAWLRRLRGSGVEFRTGSRLVGLERAPDGWRAEFQTVDQKFSLTADSIVLALGGASRPETGSDGTWPTLLAAHGVDIAPWVPANCGWEVDWPPELLARAEGLPLKNLIVRAAAESVSGELLITRHGLEGGAIYRLGWALRSMKQPRLEIDFKPQLTAETMGERAATLHHASDWFRVWTLSAGAIALLETIFPNDRNDVEQTIRRAKNFSLSLRSPRPIAEAISSGGGVRWSEVNENLMVQKLPGIFVAGEMIDISCRAAFPPAHAPGEQLRPSVAKARFNYRPTAVRATQLAQFAPMMKLAAAVRFSTPSLGKIRSRYLPIVLVFKLKILPISAFVLPRATQESTSVCRSVRVPRAPPATDVPGMRSNNRQIESASRQSTCTQRRPPDLSIMNLGGCPPEIPSESQRVNPSGRRSKG
jgi:uncharacterized flavoprotein (TIGR03862 family)